VEQQERRICLSLGLALLAAMPLAAQVVPAPETALGFVPEADRQLVQQILRGYANKLLHEPLVQIRELANLDDGYLRLDTVRRLFDLDIDPDDDGKPAS